MSDRRSPAPRNARSSPSPPPHSQNYTHDNAFSSQHSRQQGGSAPPKRSPSPARKEGGRASPSSNTSGNTNTRSSSATRAPSQTTKSRSGTTKRESKKRDVEFVFDSPLLKQENGGFIKKRKARKVSRPPRNRPAPPQRQRSAEGDEEGENSSNDTNSSNDGDSRETSQNESSASSVSPRSSSSSRSSPEKDTVIDWTNCTVGNPIARVENPEALEKELSSQLLALPSPSARINTDGELVRESAPEEQDKKDMPGGFLFNDDSSSTVDEEMRGFHEPSPPPPPPPPEQTTEVPSSATTASRSSRGRARGRGRGRSGGNASRSPSPAPRSSPSPARTPSPAPQSQSVPKQVREEHPPSVKMAGSPPPAAETEQCSETSDSELLIDVQKRVMTDTSSDAEELLYEVHSKAERQGRQLSSYSEGGEERVSLPSLPPASRSTSHAPQRISVPELSDSVSVRKKSESVDELPPIAFSSRESTPLDSPRSSGSGSRFHSDGKASKISSSQKSSKKDKPKSAPRKSLPQLSNSRSSPNPHHSQKAAEGGRSATPGSNYAPSHLSAQRAASPLDSLSSSSLPGVTALSSSFHSAGSIDEEGRKNSVDGFQSEDGVRRRNDGKMWSSSTANHYAGSGGSLPRNASETKRMQGNYSLPPPRGASLGNRSDGAGENMRDRGESGQVFLHPIQPSGSQFTSPSLSPLGGPGGALSTVKWAGGSPSSPSSAVAREIFSPNTTLQRGPQYLPPSSTVTRTLVLRKAHQENISEEAALAALMQPARLPRLGGTKAAMGTNNATKGSNRRSSSNDQYRSVSPSNHSSSAPSRDAVKKKLHNYNEPEEIIENTHWVELETGGHRSSGTKTGEGKRSNRDPRRQGSRSNGNSRDASSHASAEMAQLPASLNAKEIVAHSGNGSGRKKSEEELVRGNVLEELGLPRDELYKEFAEFVQWKKNHLSLSGAEEEFAPRPLSCSTPGSGDTSNPSSDSVPAEERVDTVLEPPPEIENHPPLHVLMKDNMDTVKRNSREERESSPIVTSPQKRSPHLPYPVAPVSAPEDEAAMNAIPRHLLFPSDSSCSDNSLPGITSHRSSTSSIGSPKVKGAASTIPPCKKLDITDAADPVVSTIKSGGRDGVIEGVMFASPSM